MYIIEICSQAIRSLSKQIALRKAKGNSRWQEESVKSDEKNYSQGRKHGFMVVAIYV